MEYFDKYFIVNTAMILKDKILLRNEQENIKREATYI